MADPSIIRSDLQVIGNLSASTMTIPATSMGDTETKAASSGDGIDAGKVNKNLMIPFDFLLEFDDEAVPKTHVIYIAQATGVIQEIRGGCYTAPTGGSGLTVSIDILKNGTTVLSATIDIDNGDSDRDLITGTLSVTALARGDWLTADVTVAGSGGTQGKGPAGYVKIHENASDS